MNDLKLNFKTVESVECIKCGGTHIREKESYITVYGNICVGEGGGILGHGYWETKGVPVNIFCRRCFVEFIGEAIR